MVAVEGGVERREVSRELLRRAVSREMLQEVWGCIKKSILFSTYAAEVVEEHSKL